MKSKFRINAPALAGMLLAAPLVASAEWDVSANVALTSDYVFRGVSQTDEDPAIQGGFDVSHDSGLYVGTWASNVDFNEQGSADPADMELDLYVGYASEIGGVSYDVSLLHYFYPGADTDFEYNELVAKLGYSGFTGTLGYSNDVFNTSETGIYYNLSYAHEFMGAFTATAGIGYYDFDENVAGPGAPDSYADYHVGVAKPFAGVDFDLSWYGTNSDGEDLYGDTADSRVVLTISKEL